MASDDYFRLVYIILSTLYESMKRGEQISLEVISPESLKIPKSYFVDIFENQLERGRVRGIHILSGPHGRTISGMGNLRITEEGIEYLQENSMMKKAYEALKEIKDWIPGI